MVSASSSAGSASSSAVVVWSPAVSNAASSEIDLLTAKVATLVLQEKPAKEDLQEAGIGIASFNEEEFKRFVDSHGPDREQLLIYRLRHWVVVEDPRKPKHMAVQRLKAEGKSPVARAVEVKAERPSPVAQAVDEIMPLVDTNQRERLTYIFSKAGSLRADTSVWLKRLLPAVPAEERAQALRAIEDFFKGLDNFSSDTTTFLTEMAGYLEKISVQHWSSLLTSTTNRLFLPKAVGLCMPLMERYANNFGSLVDTISRSYGNFSEDVIVHTVAVAKMLNNPHHLNKIKQCLADCPENRRENATKQLVEILGKLVEPERFVEKLVKRKNVLTDEEMAAFASCFLPNDTTDTAHRIFFALQMYEEHYNDGNWLGIFTKIRVLRDRGLQGKELVNEILDKMAEVKAVNSARLNRLDSEKDQSFAHGNVSEDGIADTATGAKMRDSSDRQKKIMQFLDECPLIWRDKLVEILGKLVEPEQFVEDVVERMRVLTEEEMAAFASCFLPNDTTDTARRIFFVLRMYEQFYYDGNWLGIFTKIRKLRDCGLQGKELGKAILDKMIEVKAINTARMQGARPVNPANV